MLQHLWVEPGGGYVRRQWQLCRNSPASLPWYRRIFWGAESFPLFSKHQWEQQTGCSCSHTCASYTLHSTSGCGLTQRLRFGSPEPHAVTTLKLKLWLILDDDCLQHFDFLIQPLISSVTAVSQNPPDLSSPAAADRNPFQNAHSGLLCVCVCYDTVTWCFTPFRSAEPRQSSLQVQLHRWCGGEDRACCRSYWTVSQVRVIQTSVNL